MSHPEDTSNNRKISNSNNSSKEILASSEECRKQVTFKEETVSLPKIKVFHEYTINADRPNCMDVNSNSLLLSNVTYRNKVQDAETRKIIEFMSVIYHLRCIFLNINQIYKNCIFKQSFAVLIIVI